MLEIECYSVKIANCGFSWGKNTQYFMDMFSQGLMSHIVAFYTEQANRTQSSALEHSIKKKSLLQNKGVGMLCSPTSTEYLIFQQCINNVPTVFDLLEVITSQEFGHLPLIEEALLCPNMCQQASRSQKCTGEENVNKGESSRWTKSLRCQCKVKHMRLHFYFS